MLTVINHDEPKWHAQYLARARENGAATYSRDICQYHLPLIEEWAQGRSVTVATAGAQKLPLGGGDVLVQYLHEYRYDDALALPLRVAKAQRASFGQILFVVAYEALAYELQGVGLEALYVPMAVDVSRVRLTPPTPQPPFSRRVAYFGNITSPKKALYASLTASMRSWGWEVDHVLERRPEAAWARLRRYQYGIGVGRCALEMGALGLRVLIAGAHVGGIMTTACDVAAQRATNMNGRVVTFDRDPKVCMENLGQALVGVTTDIPLALRHLQEGLNVR